jgi:hypothetical protein
MKQLTRLQHTFQQCVLNSNESVSTEWISASGRANPEIQLSIYAHAYGARLKEVLANDYPATLMAMGDEHFNQIADEYIQAHPSQFFSLRDFGQHLSNFVNEHYGHIPWLFELTLFEWTLGQAFDVADVALFTEEEMATIPAEHWPELHFTLHPSVNRLNLEWNVVEMWQALTADEPVPVEAVQDIASPWLIWRQQLSTHFRSLPIDEQLALDALGEGVNFDQICERLSTVLPEDDVPLRAAGLIKGWLTQGLISGVKKGR